MKIALISDIHGNAVALKAVLDDIASQGTNKIVCLGDVAIGPQPVEALQMVRKLQCPVVMGNGDAELLSERKPEAGSGETHQKILDIVIWCRQAPSKLDLDFVRDFRPTVSVELDKKNSLLCFHGSPRSFDDIIRSSTPDVELEPMLRGFKAEIFAGGHTHTPMLRRYNSSFLINPGSVGLPYSVDGTTGKIKNLPWAEYALIESFSNHLSVEFRRVPFDVKQFVKATLQSGMPHAEWYANEWQSLT